MSMLDEDESYSGEDDDYGNGADSSQDWQEQQQQSGAAAGGQRADSQQMSTSSARRAKRKGAYTEEERRYRRRLANRESARRMRAKRNTEVKELETTVSKLQDRNEKLEAQNKEYATTLHQLQQEMCTLRTQLQGSLGSSHQQQSSSEVHQVLSCGTAMHPQQPQMLLQGGGNQGNGLCFSGQLSFSGALNSMPPSLPGTADPQQYQMASATPAAAAAAAVAATGMSVLQQQFGPGCMQGAQVRTGGQDHADQLVWHVQAPDQQHWQLQAQAQQQQQQQELEHASAGAAQLAVMLPEQQQQGQRQPLGRTSSAATATTSAGSLLGALPHADSELHLQRLQSGLLAKQQQCCVPGNPIHAEAGPGDGGSSGDAAAGAGGALLDSGIFPPCAEELLNELLVSHALEQQLMSPASEQQRAVAAPADSGATDVAAAGLGGGVAATEQQSLPVPKLSGFRRWSPDASLLQQQQQLTGAVGGPAAWHRLLQQQACKEQQLPAVSTSATAIGHLQQQQQQQQQQLPNTAGEVAAAGEKGATAATAAAMLAARGRAFAVGYANPVTLCGFDIPDIPSAAPPAVSAPAAAAVASGTAASADPFADWTHRFLPAAGAAGAGSAAASVLKRLDSALQLELPIGATAEAAAAGGARDLGAPHQGVHHGRSGGSQYRHHRQHSQGSGGHAAPAAESAETPAARKPKRRFPLKRPSKLAAQQAAVVAAAAAAAGFNDMHATPTCRGSCDLEWDAGVAMQFQLEQQKRRRLRKQLHAAAAPVGEEAERMMSASSRVGGAVDVPSVKGDEGAAAAAAALQHTAAAAAAAANGSPTSRPRSAATLSQQYTNMWQQSAAAAALAPEAASLQRTVSSVDQRQPAYSLPWDWAGVQQGAGTSLAADGCRSYASEPGADAAAVGATGSVLDWAEGCSAAVGQWKWQLLQTEQQGLVTQNGGAATGVATDAQHQHQQAAMSPQAGVYRHASLDGAMPSPRAAAVLNAAAAAAGSVQAHPAAEAGAAATAGPGLSLQMVQLQQQLQQYVQCNRRAQAPLQQQQQQQLQGEQAAGLRRHLSLHIPLGYDTSGDLDHAVPCSPPADWSQPQQQQQQLSCRQSLVASIGPAAAAGACRSVATHGYGATSPKGHTAAPAAAATTAGPLARTDTNAAVDDHVRASSGAAPWEGLGGLTQRLVGGVDIGNLDLPSVPPELDAMLASMLQQEQQAQQQQQQRAGSAGASAQQAGSWLGDTAADGMPVAIAVHTPSGPAAAAAVGPGALDCFAGGSTGAETEDTINAQLTHEQLHQELTEASAGLQGLWLNPDTARALTQSPTGLGFSAHLGQGSALGPGPLSPVSARLAIGMPAGQGAVGRGSEDATAGTGDDVEPGSTEYMAAAAAAAGMPPWSTWHDQQQQWLDDIFSSGPMLPHDS